MKYEKIIDLIHEIDHSGITEFELQKEEFRISVKRQGAPGMSPVKAPVQDDGAKEQEILVKEGMIVRSPLVGVFHSLEEQDGSGPLAAGDRIEEGQVLGAIEAMKLMNDVVAVCSGTVTEILVKDGDLVEYGQPLFVIEG